MNDLGTSLNISSVHAAPGSHTCSHFVVPSATPSGHLDSQKEDAHWKLNRWSYSILDFQLG